MHKLRDAPGGTQKDLKSQLEDISSSGEVYVLGLGNTDRADDGAGVLVAQALKGTFPDHAFSEHDGVEGKVLDISERGEGATVFFVDAADIREMPGTVKVVRREDIKDREITTHRVPVALMASVLDKAGASSAVICVQPETIEFRGRASEPVLRAVDEVVDALRELMRARDR
jgi:hydrogenase maturation protease